MLLEARGVSHGKLAANPAAIENPTTMTSR